MPIPLPLGEGLGEGWQGYVEDFAIETGAKMP
jgi:hypothetical protein